MKKLLFLLLCFTILKVEAEDTLYIYTTDSVYTYSVSDIASIGFVGELSVTELEHITNITSFSLFQNYPNPFNPVTTIKYDLPEDSFVHLDIYDLLGREVKTLLNEVVKAGYKVVSWEGKDNNGNPVSTGMYIYRLTVNSAESNEGILVVRKMVLLR